MNSDKMITNDHYQLARMVNTGIDAVYNENVQPYRLISSSVVYSFFSLFFFFSTTEQFEKTFRILETKFKFKSLLGIRTHRRRHKTNI